MNTGAKAGSLLDIAQRTALSTALIAHKTEAEAAWAAYREIKVKMGEAYSDYEDRWYQARTASYLRVAESWSGIATPETGPLIAWIIRATGTSPFQQEATEVLEALSRGASLADLDEYAAEEGWCGRWTDLRDSALVVFPGLKTGGAA